MSGTAGYLIAPRIAWGVGAVEELASLDFERALVVVDPEVHRLGGERPAVDALSDGGAAVEAVAGPDHDPLTTDVPPLSDAATRHRADVIVAVGGGRTIDAAKAAWVRFERPDVPWAAVAPPAAVGLRAKARFIAVPSTSGSGAEARWNVRLRDPGAVIEIASRELVPDWAIVDPVFPRSMSGPLTAQTAADALARAVESLASNWASPFSDALARDSARLVLDGLPRVLKQPEDLELRGQLHAASTMAGLAASNAQPGLTDALAETVSAAFGVPYGSVAAVALPSVVEFTFPSARDKFGTLPPVFGPVGQSRTALADRLRILFRSAGLAGSLVDLGIPRPSLDARMGELVRKAARSPGAIASPRVASVEEIEGLLRSVAEPSSPTGMRD